MIVPLAAQCALVKLSLQHPQCVKEFANQPRDRMDGYDAASADLHTRCKRKRKIDMNSDRKGRQVMGAMNLFECRMIIFPLFESGIHYIYFAVDPMTLKQKVYDSLHGSLYDFDKDKDQYVPDETRVHISQSIHK